MKPWPFYLTACILFGLFVLDALTGVLGISALLRLLLLFTAAGVFLLPHIDGAMGGIKRFKASLKWNTGWAIEIDRKVTQAMQTADKAVKSLAKEFPLNLDALEPTSQNRSVGEPWSGMIRVSGLIIQRLAERMGEDPILLEEIALPDAIGLASERGKITKRQAVALNGFFEARQMLIEICLRMKGDTPVSINERAWQLIFAGEQLVSFL